MNESEIASVFGGPLESDPVVALDATSLRFPNPKIGPMPKVQFTIELVGPRSVAAAPALTVLDNPWRQGLGEPQVFVMASADTFWRKPQRPDPASSFDSLALCWDYLGARGSLSGAATARLLQTAESFGQTIQRRAMPMPTPDAVDEFVRTLAEVREAFDIGFELGVIAGEDLLPETAIWRVCARLGLSLAANGSFVWRDPRHPLPLLSVASWDEGKSFGLAGARAGVHHAAIGVGFNVPTSPDPERVLAFCFKVANALAGATGATVTDDEGVPYDSAKRREAEAAMAEAIGALDRVGLTPGSTESLRLFGAA